MPGLSRDAELSVSEAARAAGLSHARVRQLVRSGEVPSRVVGNQHVIIDPSALLSRPSRAGRPLSERSAWALLMIADGQRHDWMSPKDVYRAKAHLSRIASDPAPEVALQALVRNRAKRLAFRAQEPSSLLNDDELLPSGLSDARAGMSAGSDVEAYVHVDDLRKIVRRHLLVESSGADANVWLHVAPLVPASPLRLQVAADLAEHGGPRERSRSREIVRDVVKDVR